VYLITCLVTGKYYVGQTTWPLARRWSGHKTAAKQNQKHGHLQSSLRKYGPENHIIEVLTEAPFDELNHLERLWIIALDSTNQYVGMNLTFGGDGSGTLTDAQKSAISKRMEGNHHGLGYKWTESQLENHGKKTPEQIEAARQLMIGNTFRKGLPSWWKGKSLPYVDKLRANYWEKRANAADIKSMLQRQAGNRKGKHRPDPEFRVCSICKLSHPWSKDSRCKECGRVIMMLYRAMMKDAGFTWREF